MDNIRLSILRIMNCFKDSGSKFPCPDADACTNADICQGLELMIEAVAKERSDNDGQDL